MGPMHHERKSFIVDGPVLEPADQGWRGTLNKVRLRLDAGSDELMWREDVNPVAQHGPGQRVIAIANGKGSAHKTPTAVMLVAVFARLGDAEILAWDNNEARVSLAWRGVACRTVQPPVSGFGPTRPGRDAALHWRTVGGSVLLRASSSRR